MSFPTLPAPEVLETIDYEVLVDQIVNDIAVRLSAVGVSWDVANLETDPIKIVAEAVAYRELLLRARVNDAARANLLAFAGTSDLDHLAAFYGVSRLAEEDDERLRSRVQVEIFGRSAGGPEERYKAVALGVSTQVRDIAVYRTGRDPTVNIAVLSTAVDGVADQGLLDQVKTALEAPAVRVVSDRFNVVSAVRHFVDVTLRVRLSPEAPQSLLADLPAMIADDWQKESLLGLDLTPSWLVKAAMRPGVTKVEVLEPVADVVVEGNGAIALQNITIEDGGRGR